jgi:hypothetical protein
MGFTQRDDVVEKLSAATSDPVLSTKWKALKTTQIAACWRCRMIRLNGGRSRSIPVRADLDRGLDESTAATGNRLSP